MSKKIEHFLELLMFNSRWLLAPFYIGLIFGIVMLLVKFGQEFIHLTPHLLSESESDVVLALLTLVDMSLVANLLLIIIFSGYENFVSKIHTGESEDRPEWMGKVDFSGLKIKVIASIVAISAIELLKGFVNVTVTGDPGKPGVWTAADKALAWKVAIHMVLIVSGVLLALMDRISVGGHSEPDSKHG